MIKLKLIYYWFKILISILKDHSFLDYSPGTTGKFKLFGNQYIKQQRKEKAGGAPKSKSVTYITTLSKTFSLQFLDEKDRNFINLSKYSFLWYVSTKIQNPKEEELNESKMDKDEPNES